MFEKGGGYLSGAAYNQGIGVRQLAQQLCRRRREYFPACFVKQGDAPITDFVRDNNFHCTEVIGTSHCCQLRMCATVHVLCSCAERIDQWDISNAFRAI